MQGILTINGKDAYTTWGITLADGSLSALMTPAPLKPHISNKSRAEDGRQVLGIGPQSRLAHRPRIDDRTITLVLNISAPSEEAFLQRYASFCEVLHAGILDIRTKYQPNLVYHLIYESCQQFRAFALGIGSFTLRLSEYNPASRQ